MAYTNVSLPAVFSSSPPAGTFLPFSAKKQSADIGLRSVILSLLPTTYCAAGAV